MAKLYNKKNHEVYWSDSDIACAVEEAFWELSDFIVLKKDLDGHMRDTQWYMAMYNKLDELIALMVKCPYDEASPEMTEIM